MKSYTALTIKDLADLELCPCAICSSQDLKVEDNFEQIGRKSFARLVLSALELTTQVNHIDKHSSPKLKHTRSTNDE